MFYIMLEDTSEQKCIEIGRDFLYIYFFWQTVHPKGYRNISIGSHIDTALLVDFYLIDKKGLLTRPSSPATEIANVSSVVVVIVRSQGNRLDVWIAR